MLKYAPSRCTNTDPYFAPLTFGLLLLVLPRVADDTTSHIQNVAPLVVIQHLPTMVKGRLLIGEGDGSFTLRLRVTIEK